MDWLLAALFGRSYPFVNLSSLAPLYGERLVCAYLGASNKDRAKPASQAVSVQLTTDDLPLLRYRPHERGCPLHLINVTVNETFAGRSQVEQRDRKGMGMAIGPAGVSVGARHHAVWTERESKGSSKDQQTGERDLAGEPKKYELTGELRPTEEPRKEGTYRVFPSHDAPFTPRLPTLGEWMAISGAAVSTGLGSRTNLALSLLAGLFNFRLGHWWRSGFEPTKRSQQGSQPPSRLATVTRQAARLFPVQAHLINELLARFPGTSGRDWYLTDGGHFENTGAYELIRRRLEMIIVCDNGEDAVQSFEDLGNLVRKVRVDFGAEINFVDSGFIKTLGEEQNVIGTLAELGFAEAADVSRAVDESGRPPRLTRCAALARITHGCSSTQMSDPA